MKIGILIADETEYRPFVKAAERLAACRQVTQLGNSGVSFSAYGAQVTAVCCGVGKVNAAMAAAFLAADGVQLIGNIGLSGAVSGVRRGDLVLGTSFVEADFDLSALGYAKGQKPQDESVYRCEPDLLEACGRAVPRAVRGALATGDFFLTDETRRREYAELFHMTAFDMETGAIAAVCQKAGIPFFSIRKMSDDASDAAICDYREMAALEEEDLSECLLAALKEICR